MENKVEQRIIDNVAITVSMLQENAKKLSKEDFVSYYFNVWPLLNDAAKKKRIEALYNEYAPKKK